MNFEDIGRVWREEPGGEFRRRHIEDLSAVLGQAEGFLAPLYRRGTRVFAITLLLVVPVFMWAALNAPRPWLVTPGVVMVWTWLAVIWGRWRNLRRPSSDSSLPIRAAVEAEVERLRFLERFWGRVSWSLGLFLVGEVLVFEGLRPPSAGRGPMSLFFYGLMIVVLALIVFRNPVYARHKVRPLREDLESWLAGLQAWEGENREGAGSQRGTS